MQCGLILSLHTGIHELYLTVGCLAILWAMTQTFKLLFNSLSTLCSRLVSSDVALTRLHADNQNWFVCVADKSRRQWGDFVNAFDDNSVTHNVRIRTLVYCYKYRCNQYRLKLSKSAVLITNGCSFWLAACCGMYVHAVLLSSAAAAVDCY